MGVTRDFDAMLAEKAGIRPTFRIAGQTFTLRAKLPYAKWNKLLAGMRDADTDEKTASEEFFRTVLIKADRERFLDLLASEDEDDELVVGMDQIGEITDWAMGHFTGKAPSSSNSSSPGANATGVAPSVVSLDPRVS